jgi:hypothetical protein
MQFCPIHAPRQGEGHYFTEHARISARGIQHWIEVHDSIALAGAKSLSGIATGGCAALATG